MGTVISSGPPGARPPPTTPAPPPWLILNGHRDVKLHCRGCWASRVRRAQDGEAFKSSEHAVLPAIRVLLITFKRRRRNSCRGYSLWRLRLLVSLNLRPASCAASRPILPDTPAEAALTQPAPSAYFQDFAMFVPPGLRRPRGGGVREAALKGNSDGSRDKCIMYGEVPGGEAPATTCPALECIKAGVPLPCPARPLRLHFREAPPSECGGLVSWVTRSLQIF